MKKIKAIPHEMSSAKTGNGKKSPLMLYRSYDFSAVCCRENEKNSRNVKPLSLHVAGSGECSLAHIALLGCVAVSAVAAASGVGKLLCAAHYRRRYKKKYEEKLRHMQQKQAEKQLYRREKDAAVAEKRLRKLTARHDSVIHASRCAAEEKCV